MSESPNLKRDSRGAEDLIGSARAEADTTGVEPSRVSPGNSPGESLGDTIDRRLSRAAGSAGNGAPGAWAGAQGDLLSSGWICAAWERQRPARRHRGGARRGQAIGETSEE